MKLLDSLRVSYEGKDKVLTTSPIFDSVSLPITSEVIAGRVTIQMRSFFLVYETLAEKKLMWIEKENCEIENVPSEQTSGKYLAEIQCLLDSLSIAFKRWKNTTLGEYSNIVAKIPKDVYSLLDSIVTRFDIERLNYKRDTEKCLPFEKK
jgi:hypothetical protein